jgi:hypothetical protein
MTRLQAVGVLLVALGLIYALLYVGWIRKQRRHSSAGVAAEQRRSADIDTGASPASTDDGATQIVAEGTYISTTTAASRLERVTVEGLGNRAKATLTVRRGDLDQLVRIERQGESTVVVPASRLLSVRRDRGMAGKFIGSRRVLVIQWRADDGAIYETGFLPRYRADVDKVESALWWHSGDSAPSTATDQPKPPVEGETSA